MRLSVLVIVLAGRIPSADADAPSSASTLEQYFDALEARRLLAVETGSVERLRAAIRDAERAFFEQRWDDATRVLYEVVESPRFRDFSELEEYHGAELLLARSLHRLGAQKTATRYLARILARGPDENRYFAPAFQRYVDVVLDSGNLPAGIERLEALVSAQLPRNSRDELHYLKGRARYDAGDTKSAEAELERISKTSRFYANAQYLRGAMAARRGALREAEGHFCSIATTGDRDRYSFYVDERYFRIKDLTWLALGRIAHEGRRSDDAFYYYFQVPKDSERVAEALFEAAYATYEGEDPDTALDLLDQLDGAFPASSHADEAKLLRGYIHLERCEFEQADRLFEGYQGRFLPMVREIDRILASPARRARLYDDLLATERRREAAPAHRSASTHALILAMLRVDPVFFRLHRDVQALDAEAARAGRLATEIEAIAVRLAGDSAPRPAVEMERFEDDAAELSRQLVDARAVAQNLVEQLDVLRKARAPRSELSEIERAMNGTARRLATISKKLSRARAGVGAESPQPVLGPSLEGLLASDLAHARRLPARVAGVRAKLVQAANQHALRALRDLKTRLSAGIRRSRIGRIDAVMGSKRRIEIQIESLAAGRFPPELMDPLKVQGLLHDREEYWPYEGELWEDEIEETIPRSGRHRRSR